jgi:Tfp pilus assembly protein PilF
MNEKRGPWYLLTGLVIGAVLGLLYAWVVRPVQYTNTAPNSLRADYKDQYRAIIAVAYLANGDLLRARARLELLQDPDLYRVLAEQAQASRCQTFHRPGHPQHRGSRRPFYKRQRSPR